MKLKYVLLQSALNSAVKGKSEDKAAAAAALKQQLAAKDRELQKEAELEVAEQDHKHLQEAANQSAGEYAAKIARAAARLSQAKYAHTKEIRCRNITPT